MLYANCDKSKLFTSKEDALKSSSEIARKHFLSKLTLFTEGCIELGQYDVVDFNPELSDDDIVEEMMLFNRARKLIYETSFKEIEEE